MRVVLASSNPGKLRELAELLAPLGMELVSQTELGIEGAEESAETFVENALAKARHASRVAGLPAIADDSGISVDALHGAPGVRSARYAGDRASDADNNRKLLDALADSTDTSAHYDCIMVYLEYPADPTPVIASGRWDGRIIATPRGDNGFGYDPYFVPDGLSRTAAELPPAEKNRISHRGQAVAALLELLGQRKRRPAER